MSGRSARAGGPAGRLSGAGKTTCPPAWRTAPLPIGSPWENCPRASAGTEGDPLRLRRHSNLTDEVALRAELGSPDTVIAHLTRPLKTKGLSERSVTSSPAKSSVPHTRTADRRFAGACGSPGQQIKEWPCGGYRVSPSQRNTTHTGV
jgi:hypothetical protein